jgi:hypothetical protein
VADIDEQASSFETKRAAWIRTGPAVKANAGCNNLRAFYSGTLVIYDDSADIRVRLLARYPRSECTEERQDAKTPHERSHRLDVTSENIPICGVTGKVPEPLRGGARRLNLRYGSRR